MNTPLPLAVRAEMLHELYAALLAPLGYSEEQGALAGDQSARAQITEVSPGADERRPLSTS